MYAQHNALSCRENSRFAFLYTVAHNTTHRSGPIPEHFNTHNIISAEGRDNLLIYTVRGIGWRFSVNWERFY